MKLKHLNRVNMINNMIVEIDEALRATVRKAVTTARPHPMRGTPLPEVLHSGVLARRNAFGSLFKAKQKSGAGATATSDAPRDFDLSRDVERCDIFLSHSWGVPFETEACARLAACLLR